MAIFILPATARADVIRVKTDGSDGYDGGSWGNAVQTLVKALSLADPNANPKDQIWVAAGTYYPDEGLGRTNNDPSYYFELVNNVAVYGGFAGTESDLNQRDWKTNVTVLSGDIDQDDTGEEPDNGNCYNILRSVPNASADTILDGFTVTRGRAYGGTTYTNGGAAFANRGQNTNVTFRNCLFSNHRGHGAGAIGIHNNEIATRNAVTFEDCTFLNNKSTGSTDEQNQIFPWGGAVYLSLRSNATFRRCSFVGNQTASRGGAVAHGHSKGTYLNCLFSGNTASERGGAIYLHDDAWNEAEDRGEAAFTNCTFSKNASPGSTGGGAVYAYAKTSNDSDVVTVANSIIWDNTSSGGSLTDQIKEEEVDGGTVTVTVTYTDLHNGGYSGTGNINGDPHFRDADGPDETAGTLDDDARLGKLSSCANAGNNQAPAGDYDLDGNTRIVETYCDSDGEPDSATIDMGAYEYQAYGLIHVDKDATGDNDGTSWTDAYTDLQSALADAAAEYEVCEIWVAEGTYKPDDCTACGTGDRASTFTLVDGVGVYGGFVGGANGETERDQRDPASHETILDGEIGLASLTRVYHVVTIPANALGGTILDGFTIKRGKADGTSAANYDRGGGIYLVGGSSVIQDCELSDNDGIHGGALYLGTNAQPTLKQLDFWENTATYGGAIYATQAAPQMSDCVFSGNIADNGSHAGNGGAVYVTSGTPSAGGFNVTRCQFSGNESEDHGGAFYISGSSGAEPAFRNCQFSTNKARKNGSNEHVGGAIYTQRAMFLLNCTFARNIATLANGGGALYLAGGNTDIKNCIFWENKADGDRSDEADQIVVYAGSPTARNTCIEDMDGAGVLFHNTNTDADPKFFSSGTDDYELNPLNCGGGGNCTSSAIDRGEDDYCFEAPCLPHDVDGRTRRINLDDLPDDVDMGSLETQSP